MKDKWMQMEEGNREGWSPWNTKNMDVCCNMTGRNEWEKESNVGYNLGKVNIKTKLGNILQSCVRHNAV